MTEEENYDNNCEKDLKTAHLIGKIGAGVGALGGIIYQACNSKGISISDVYFTEIGAAALGYAVGWYLTLFAKTIFEGVREDFEGIRGSNRDSPSELEKGIESKESGKK